MCVCVPKSVTVSGGCSGHDVPERDSVLRRGAGLLLLKSCVLSFMRAPKSAPQSPKVQEGWVEARAGCGGSGRVQGRPVFSHPQ